MHVDPFRLTAANQAPERPDGRYVLYWMTAARRPHANWALQHAIAQAAAYGRPLVVLEALRVAYPHASDRMHRFAIDGMDDNRAAFAATPITYLPYVEPQAGAGSGLVETLAARACLVVTDDYPAFFLPRMLAAVAARVAVRVVAVDGNGLLPLRAASTAYGRAVDFRRHLQRIGGRFLGQWPDPQPLTAANRLPRLTGDLGIGRWPLADLDALVAGGIARLPIDHAVPVVDERGGWRAAEVALRRFLDHRLERYAERSHPDSEAGSDLSPWLKWGHLSAQAVARAVLDRAGWSPERLGPVTASKEGWWGIDAASEAFLDELVTWRELGYGYCCFRADHASYASLPDWCRATLAAHAGDPRPQRYDLAALDAAATHDPVWNAAQRQLVATGRMHNYLRMLWGKKVLEWSPSPEAAWDILFHLNDRYALDGRDPNTASGVGWVFGRFDRPWAPQRPIFGTIRYMSSDNTVRKLHLKQYLARWSGQQQLFA